jgi:hypothetical protein
MVWHRNTIRTIKWLWWIVVSSRSSHMLLMLTSKRRIHLLRNFHKRRGETHLSLGRIASVTQGRIVCLIILREITNFPLRRVTRVTLRRVRIWPLGRKRLLVLRTPSGIRDPWEGLSIM